MAVINLVDQAEEAGVIFVLNGPRVGLRGDPTAIKEWAPRLRKQRGAVLREVQKRQAGMHRRWIIRPPMRAAFTVACPQGATAAEVHAVWPSATVEPADD